MLTYRTLKLAVIPFAFIAASCSSPQQVSFTSDVRPILTQNCISCHHAPNGQGYLASGLNLTSYQTLMKGTKYGPVVVPGSAIGSTLVRLIRHEADPSIAMPRNHHPGEPANWLAPSQIHLIAQWINQGAKDN
ncbi:MAG: hypothetical protein M0037_09025 [Betaproteobacteria bacterium]|nr:hypothetical protein [Betaproteobacteria bacterium]